MDISEEFKENINDAISLILETIKEKFDTQKKKITANRSMNNFKL